MPVFSCSWLCGGATGTPPLVWRSGVGRRSGDSVKFPAMKSTPFVVDWKKTLSPTNIGSPGEGCHFVDDPDPPSAPSKTDNVVGLSDHELEEAISRTQSSISIVAKSLPDKGLKLRARLVVMQAERAHRREARLKRMKAGETEKAEQSGSCFRDTSHQSHSDASLASTFSCNLEYKQESSSCGGFEGELKYFGGSKCKDSKQALHVKLDKNILSRRLLFQSPNSICSTDKHRRGKGNLNGTSSRSSPFHVEGKMFTRLSEKRAQLGSLLGSKTEKVQTVVLLDEDEQSSHPVEVTKSPQRDKVSKIYYPSRNDPELVELCRSDMECLDPGSPLSSPVMNFYIRFLQRLKERPVDDYYFFNTYFYNKLEEAVSCKGSNKNALYEKVRRWWKGVNIFQKAYIFLPIYADQHWSLIIICMPAKEDECGPIMLHLDSLGYHPSLKIFENVESFLKEEWNCLNQGDSLPDVPWMQLNRRIDRKEIVVPQQKNDYDCGLFVLYFMERFILEAPKRLRRKDLHMFGRTWFQPEEASGLRKKIRRLLLQLFESKLENENNDGHMIVEDSQD